MSLLPYLFDNFRPSRPSRMIDQHFGMGLNAEDLLVPFTVPRQLESMGRCPMGYYRPWRALAADRDAGSTVAVDKDKFQVNLDVQHFAPEEITVKVSDDNTITIEGNHEEKEDEHGYVSRRFVRKYVLPKGHDVQKLESSLSSDGVLTITAPKTDSVAIEHRNIPIQQTGAPSKSIQEKTKKASEGAEAKE